MDLWQPVKSALDWKRIRDAYVPEVSEHDPALARVRAQLTGLERHPAPPGIDPISGEPYTELYKELRQSLLDEIERYRWRKAGFNVTQDVLDMMREEEREIRKVHQDMQEFLKEVDASLETQQTYEVLTAQGVWRHVRVSWVSHDYAHPEEIDAAEVKVIDLEHGESVLLFGAELPVRLRERGQPARRAITEADIQQVINRDIIGRACETLSGEGWLRTYIDLLELPGPDWYHARVRVGGITILQGVEIVTRLRFPNEDR